MTYELRYMSAIFLKTTSSNIIININWDDILVCRARQMNFFRRKAYGTND